jgi:tRNA (guanine37-N1)-methyltransferase
VFMRFIVISLFPNEVVAGLSYGVTGRALERELISLETINPREFAYDNYRRIDDKSYGGGPGMVMMLEPLRAALDAAKAKLPGAPVILLSPQGRTLNQEKVRSLSNLPAVILLCGRYEGIDQRIVEHYVDEEISLGDYVLSGGELGAQIIIDAITRLLPGALNTAASADEDSFENGLLDFPHYTRPEHSDLGSVPEVLLSGNHAQIKEWRRAQSLRRTRARRLDLFDKVELTKRDLKLLED